MRTAGGLTTKMDRSISTFRSKIIETLIRLLPGPARLPLVPVARCQECGGPPALPTVVCAMWRAPARSRPCYHSLCKLHTAHAPAHPCQCPTLACSRLLMPGPPRSHREEPQGGATGRSHREVHLSRLPTRLVPTSPSHHTHAHTHTHTMKAHTITRTRAKTTKHVQHDSPPRARVATTHV